MAWGIDPATDAGHVWCFNIVLLSSTFPLLAGSVDLCCICIWTLPIVFFASVVVSCFCCCSFSSCSPSSCSSSSSSCSSSSSAN